MKKSIKMLLPLIATNFLFSNNALAAPYISGQVGVYGYGNNNPYNNLTDNDNDIALTGRVGAGFLGSLSENVKVGIESGYTANKHISIGDNLVSIEAKRWSIDLLGVLDLYASQNVDVFAKAGVAYVKQEYPFFLDSARIGSINSDELVPKAVVGFGYNITKNTNLNLSVNHEFQKEEDLLPGATSLMAGIRFSFA